MELEDRRFGQEEGVGLLRGRWVLVLVRVRVLVRARVLSLVRVLVLWRKLQLMLCIRLLMMRSRRKRIG